jgi:hypothetical protein
MQKLVVKSQFMGVKPCVIEIHRFLLLIGEQASGKSTIAKLIYFFQTLPDAIYKSTLLNQGRGNFDYILDINSIARSTFVDTFGLTTRSEGVFDIEFWYNESSYLNIHQGEKDRLVYAKFEENMGFNLGGVVRKFIQTPRGTDVENIFTREFLLKGLSAIFNQANTNFNYIIAGRNTVVAYPDLIGEKVRSELEKLVEDEVREQDFEKKKRRGNEMLFLEFVNWSEGIRKYFRTNGGTFDRVVRQQQLQNKDALAILIKITKKILKGKYESNDSGESLIPDGSRVPIDFKDASSGQQEVLRILQGLFVSIGTTNRKEFLVVEEPEAHLYPLAQKELVNAFAVFLNTIQEGRIVITTHSPYILACVNILLFAQYVSNQIGKSNHNGSLADVSDAYWLDAAFFNAYSLSNSDAYCQDIKDAETGLIDQNYLDLISEQLGLQYHQLYQMLD